MKWEKAHYIVSFGDKWKMACGLSLAPEDDNSSETYICTIIKSVANCGNCRKVIDAKKHNLTTY